MLAMKPATRHRLDRRVAALPAGFQRVKLGRWIIYLRTDLASRAAALTISLSTLGSAQGSGNRLSGHRLTLEDGTELFARVNRRGGLLRRVFKDLYLGIGARPARELAVAAEARRRGIPVAEPMGAMVEGVAPIVYRSIFLTRALPGMTLWEFICTDDDALVGAHVIRQARLVIDRMHQLGLFHADLNLHNLFITQAHESFAVAILDLDKAKLFDGPLPAWMRARNLARLQQSAQKLDPKHRFLDSRALELLTRG
jgi:hypothetical protein